MPIAVIQVILIIKSQLLDTISFLVEQLLFCIASDNKLYLLHHQKSST